MTGDVEVTGDLVVSGAYRGSIGPHGGAPFPRPAYDSGWREIEPDTDYTLDHNLGGELDNYVVDLQFYDVRGGGLRRHQMHYGGDTIGTTRRGAWWHNLTGEQITVSREEDDIRAAQFRIRIWVYN